MILTSTFYMLSQTVFRRILFAVLSFLFVFGGFVFSQCHVNIGFEQNSFNLWTGQTGSHTGTIPVNTPTNGIVAGRHTLTTGGNDAIVTAIPQLCPIPGFGSYSVRLGNSGTGAQAERLTTTFTVTPQTSALLFAFAVILEDPGHSQNSQPRFELNITQPNGQPLPCGNYLYIAGNNLPGFQTQGGTRYRNWQQQSLNLIPFIGQTISVNVLTADCSASGHYGYGYFDMTCNLFQVIRRYCPGDQDAVLTAPSGFTYQWAPTGQTTQSILIQQPVNGATYSVTMIPQGGSIGCSVTLFDTIRLLSSSTSIINNTCNGATSGQASVGITGGTPLYNYTWSSSPTQTTQTATGLRAGTYRVTIVDAAGCTLRDSVRLVDPPPIANTTTSTPVSCFGGSNGTAGITMQGGTPPFLYSWNTVPVQNTTTSTGLTAGTWIVTVSDQGGCATPYPIIVTQPTQLQSQATFTPVLCFGASTGTGSVNANGGTGQLTYSWNSVPIQNTTNANNLPAGTYTVTITDQNACTTSNTISIPEPPQITSTTTTSPVSCFAGSDGTAQVNAGGGVGNYTYSWNTNPIQTSTISTGLQATTYTVTVIDGNGCVHSNTAIPIEPTAIQLTTTFTAVSCFAGSDGNTSVIAQGGTPGYTYSWNTIPVQLTDSAFTLIAGNYTVTVTDANLCVQTQTITVTQPTLLTSTATTTRVSCYNGSDGTATAVPSGATPGYTFVWNTIPNQSVQTATGLSNGTYQVLVNDANNCSTYAQVTITQPTQVTAAAAGTDALCMGSADGTATGVGNGGTPGYSYSWNSIPTQLTQTATGIPAGTYTVTVTDQNNCSATADVVIGQPTQLDGNTSYTPTLCFGSSEGTVYAEGFNATPGYTYSWATNPVQQTQIATGLPAGTYTVTITDGHNCSITRRSVITEPTLVVLSGTFTPPSCYGGSDATTTVSAIGGIPGYTYSWNTPQNQLTQTATGVRAGSWTATVSDMNNCTHNLTILVTQPTQLDGSITVQDVRCFGGSDGSLTATGLYATGPYSYAWQTTPPQLVPTASGLAIGQYSVVITDMNGCSITRTGVVNQPALLTSTMSFTEPTCFRGTDATVTGYVSGGTQPYTYFWSNNRNYNSPSQRGIGFGTYEMKVQDANGCQLGDGIYVTQPPPVPQPIALPDSVCPGFPAQLQASAQPGLNILWFDQQGDVAPFTGGTAIMTQELYGSFPYFIQTVDNKGCTSVKVTNWAYVFPQPIANFNSDRNRGEIPHAIFAFTDLSSSPAGIASYSWEFGDGGLSNFSNPIHQYDREGLYPVKLTVVDSNGCIDIENKSNFVEVELLVGVVPPNAFSPNGDGSNDFFYIEDYNIREWEVTMYDRWGNQVYYTRDLNFRWDGAVNTQPLPEGTYMYILRGIALNGVPVERTGTVLLVR